MRAHTCGQDRGTVGEAELAPIAVGRPPSDVAVATTGPWPCGYCRIDSLAEVGCRCPACGRNKAPAWWKICRPTPVRTASSDAIHRSQPAGLGRLKRTRRHATAIALVAIFTAGLGLSAVLAVRSAVGANDAHPRHQLEVNASAQEGNSPDPVSHEDEKGKSR